jgi:hypothetical protein
MKMTSQDRKIEKNLIKLFFNYLIKSKTGFIGKIRPKKRFWNMNFAKK